MKLFIKKNLTWNPILNLMIRTFILSDTIENLVLVNTHILADFQYQPQLKFTTI